MAANDKLCYTAQDIAATMQISLPLVYDLMKQEDFPAIRVNRCIRVPKAAFEDWLMNSATNKAEINTGRR